MEKGQISFERNLVFFAFSDPHIRYGAMKTKIVAAQHIFP